MTGQRGRGRPATFDEPLRHTFLTAVTNGMTVTEAAAHVGLHRNVPTRHARTDPGFASRLADAKAAGRKRRIEDLPHDEYRYNVHGCRCPRCRAAATTGRAGRRADQPPAEGDDITPASRESPTSFLLPERLLAQPPWAA